LKGLFLLWKHWREEKTEKIEFCKV
jgi:hypothetical protein